MQPLTLSITYLHVHGAAGDFPPEKLHHIAAFLDVQTQYCDQD